MKIDRYYIEGKHFFDQSKMTNKEYIKKGSFLYENVKENKSSIKGTEYFSNGSVQDAINLKNKCFQIKENKTTASLLIEHLTKKKVSVKQIAELNEKNHNQRILDDSYSEADFVQRARWYLEADDEINNLVSNETLIEWYYKGLGNKLKLYAKSYDLNIIGDFVGDPAVEELLKRL